MSFQSKATILLEKLQNHYNKCKNAEINAINQRPMLELIQSLQLDKYVKQGNLQDHEWSTFLDIYLSASTRLHHPGCLAHQVAPSHSSASLAAMLDSFTNNPAALYEMGPAASSVEFFLINWMLQKVGWRPCPVDERHNSAFSCAAGVFTHGGSLANLTALIAARNHLIPNSWKNGVPNNLALMAPPACHYSIARAAGILGIGSQSIFILEVDNQDRIIPERLSACYERLQNEGKRPIALVANACGTAIGLYDPLDEIADFCQQKQLWMHVDGAHGASVLLSEKYNYLMKGIYKADSLIWDAHKMLRTPSLCAALLMKERRHLDNAFRQDASYMMHDKEEPGFDFFHRTVECTKASQGLKLFTVLAELGERGIAEYIESRTELALNCYEHIQQLALFKCAVRPDSNILCFRIDGDDALQLKIRDRLHQEGMAYISSAIFQGLRWLRFVFMNPDTTMENIKQYLARIEYFRQEIVAEHKH